MTTDTVTSIRREIGWSARSLGMSIFARRPSRISNDGAGEPVSESMRWCDVGVCRQGDTFEQTERVERRGHRANAVHEID